MSTAMALDSQIELGIIAPIRDCPEVKLRGNPGRAEYCEHCLAQGFCAEMFSAEHNSDESWEILAQFVGSDKVDNVLRHVQGRNATEIALLEAEFLRREQERFDRNAEIRTLYIRTLYRGSLAQKRKAEGEAAVDADDDDTLIPQHQLDGRKVEV